MKSLIGKDIKTHSGYEKIKGFVNKAVIKVEDIWNKFELFNYTKEQEEEE